MCARTFYVLRIITAITAKVVVLFTLFLFKVKLPSKKKNGRLLYNWRWVPRQSYSFCAVGWHVQNVMLRALSSVACWVGFIKATGCCTRPTMAKPKMMFWSRVYFGGCPISTIPWTNEAVSCCTLFSGCSLTRRLVCKVVRQLGWGASS